MWVGQGDFDKQWQCSSLPQLLEQRLATELAGCKGNFESCHAFDLVEFADGLYDVGIIAGQRYDDGDAPGGPDGGGAPPHPLHARVMPRLGIQQAAAVFVQGVGPVGAAPFHGDTRRDECGGLYLVDGGCGMHAKAEAAGCGHERVL